MNWIDRDILGLKRQDKIGAPKYYEDVVNPGWGKPVRFEDHYGPTPNPVGERWQNDFHDRVRPKHYNRDDFKDMDRKNKDNNKDDKVNPPVTKPETVPEGKPLEEAPALPQPGPVDPKVEPRAPAPDVGTPRGR